MPEKELRDYIFWIKEQLDERVSIWFEKIN
jgi:hypothetical protein